MNYKEKWNKAMDFEAYLKLIEDLLSSGKSTGPNQSDDLLNYSKINLHRMKRIEKTFTPQADKLDAFAKSPWSYVLVITEGWCGDAAQIAPVVQTAMSLSDVETRFILRDEHTDLIDQHLTNGGRSIPIILFLNQDFQVIGKWGPRPIPAQQLVLDYKNQPEPKPPYSEFSKSVQMWYNLDKQKSMLAEWAELI